MHQRSAILAVCAFLLAQTTHDARAASPAEEKYAIEDRSIEQLQEDLRAGRTTSEHLVHTYLRRIETLDHTGPHLHSVLTVNPNALEQARALDKERKRRGPRGPMHGIPILIKDNIESADPMATTAGSLALKENFTGRDGPVIAALRDAGAIMLGKANLSEWANFRSDRSINGWSAMGGLTRNPYVLDRTTCGSSSGTAAAVAASLAAAGVGTETDGSITCPASMTALVGLKPTFGLLSQQFVVPVAHSQDTLGPMGRSVKDVAILLTAMTGGRIDYASALSLGSLQGKRIGVLALQVDKYPELEASYTAACQLLKAAGATLIEVQLQNGTQVYSAESVVLISQFKRDLNEYLSGAPERVKTRSLADLIEFNNRTPAESEFFGEEILVRSEAGKGVDNPAYHSALQLGKQWAKQSIDQVLVRDHLDLLVGPTSGAAWRIDVVNGDHATKAFGSIPAVSGYPHLTVPMGFIRELPVGLSLIGMPNSEPELLSMAYAFESLARARHAPKFIPTIDNPDLWRISKR